MPLYVDRHDAPGLTPEEIADAHTRDVEVQAKHRVHYHTYWFDPANGSVFCLAEGPSKQALEAVHQEAHGLLAEKILELNPNVPLNELFGARPEFPLGTPYAAPAMRAIVFTDLAGSVEQTSRLGDDGHLEVLRVHNKIIREKLGTHGGREVKHTGDGIMAAFTSVASAVAFAIAAQRAFHDHNQSSAVPLDVKIGISAGEPVTDDHDDLFGAAVQLAARLCGFASAGEIVASVAVRELSVGKQFRFEDRGLVQLKGLPEPIAAYRVAWRDDDNWGSLLQPGVGSHRPQSGRPIANAYEPDPKRVQRRAEPLLPEERKGGSDDPSVQAEEILAESDARTEDRVSPPGKPVEHRHSEDTVEPTD